MKIIIHSDKIACYMLKKLAVLIFSMFFLTGCTLWGNQTTPQEQQQQTEGADSNADLVDQLTPEATSSGEQNGIVVPLTRQELAKHASADDCWLLIDGLIYDVTAFAPTHPGEAEVIHQNCGKDASAAFATKGDKGEPHSSKATDLMKKFYLGALITQ